MKRICSYCGKTVEIVHRHRMLTDNAFCDKKCEGNFRKKSPNIRCVTCGKPMAVKPYRIHRVSSGDLCCSKVCSNKLKETTYTGTGNPNSIHKYNLEDIYNVTHDGAYILGLIYSDGHIESDRVEIYQHREFSGNLLNKVSERLTGEWDNVVTTRNVSKLSIYSKELSAFIMDLGGISCGKKSATVGLPAIPSDKLWSFICGYFDGDGSFRYDYKVPKISIYSNSTTILDSISKVWEVNYAGKNQISASGYKALDICGKMYQNVSFKHRKKYNHFMDILNWEPFPNNGWYNDLYFKCKKLSPEAIVPSKSRVTDSGYDIYAVDISYDEKNDIYVADTRLSVEPIPGWYFDMIGRSSLPKSGFMFIGGVGVIDRSYVGPIKMLLKKINTVAELPSVPFKIAQLIPRKTIHVEFVEVDDLGDSSRGVGGFGSTGN